MPAKSRRRLSGISYRLKITLQGSKPSIWRRILVPAECNLETLHAVIQDAMGWSDDHLHAFRIHGEAFMGRSPMGDVMESDGVDAAEYRLCDVVTREKTKFSYEYDFGDSWEHTILVEKILPPPGADDPKSPPFLCLAGAGACPPEDCGGIWGYYDLLDALKNPKNKSRDELLDWVGDNFDPEAFDLSAVNKRLARLRFH